VLAAAKQRAAGLAGEDVPDAVLADLSRSVEQCFDGVTIQDLVARAKKQPHAPYVI
jgi:hypothetical protein